MVLQLDFHGWFQCRLATDPDPSDEPRGVSGWTYAIAGEPDLDRIIRTQSAGTVHRDFCPDVGVQVTGVSVDGIATPGHVLNGAAVDLLSSPVFEGRNGISSEDTEEPVFPFHIRFEKGGMRLEREFRDLTSGDWVFRKSEGIQPRPAVLALSGMGDPATYLADRMAALQKGIAESPDPLKKLGYGVRLRHLGQRGLGPIPPVVGLAYRYTLDGPWARIEGPENLIGGTIDSSPWLFDFWMGCWDADALCGYMIGSATLPFIPVSA